MRACLPAVVLLLCVTILPLLHSCGGTQGSLLTSYSPPGPSLAGDVADMQAQWPASLPADQPQPWEQLDGAGYVIPPGGAQRAGQAINAQSDFTPGVERYSEAGDVTKLGEASRLVSAAGSLSYALYRIELGGQQPGAISADVNLRPHAAGGQSEYWLGLSDYGSGRWEWHGPLSDAHARLSLPGGDYLSGLGNLFVCMVVEGGAACDAVCLGVNLRDGGDTDAPPQPAGLTAAPVASGLELSWNGVIAGDLAGYRIYHSSYWFYDQQAVGLSTVPYLEGGTRHVLGGLSGETYLRISAVDTSGNESPLSELAVATPLTGAAPALSLMTDQVSGLLGLTATLTAAGADSYDWDLDGDGTYEVTGDDTGIAEVDTTRTGIIRPAVRGLSDGGSAVALGAVSLLVAGNARPVASAYADPSWGPAPLAVLFTAEGDDPDGEIALYSWDFTGDGTYDWSDPSDTTPPVQYYGTPHLYNVKLRVEDDQGAFDVDTVSVQIVASADNQAPLAKIATDRVAGNSPLHVSFDASASHDPDGDIAKYEWDWDSDGVYDSDAGTNPDTLHVWYSPGYYTVTLRVTDDDGATATDFVNLTARGPYVTMPDWQDDVGAHCSLATVNGFPAIAYHDSTNGALKFVRALDRDGMDWAEPQTVHDEFHEVGRFASLAIVNGRPAISYFMGSGVSDLYYIQATDTNGDSWKTPVAVDDGLGRGMYSQLMLVSNAPAIVYLDTGNEDVLYLRADDLNGDIWTDTPVVVAHIGWGIEALYDCMGAANIDGRPAVAYYDMANDCLKFIRADDSLGGAWTGPGLTVDDAGDVGRNPSLARVDGYPAIAYYDVDNDVLKYASAWDYAGTDWRDPIVLDDAAYTGEHSCLAVVNGHPVVSYRRLEYTTEWVGRLRYIRALDRQGRTWGLPVELANAGDTLHSSVAEINGSLAINYYQELNANLMYTLIVE